MMQTTFPGSLVLRIMRTQAMAAALILAGCDDDGSQPDAAGVANAADAAVDSVERGGDGGVTSVDAAQDRIDVASDGGLTSGEDGASAGSFSRVCARFNPDASGGGVTLSSVSAVGWRVRLDRPGRIQRLAVSVEGSPSYGDAGMPEITLGLVRLDGPNDEPDRPSLAGADKVVAVALPLPRTVIETVLAATFGPNEGPVVTPGWYAILLTTNVGDGSFVPLTIPTQDPVANTRCEDGTYPFSLSASGTFTLQSASPHLVLEGDLL